MQVRNYTETGFLKIRAPDAVFRIIREFWEANNNMQTVEWDHPSSYHNTWEAQTTILRVDNKTLNGGGMQLHTAIANAARSAMEVRIIDYIHACMHAADFIATAWSEKVLEFGWSIPENVGFLEGE